MENALSNIEFPEIFIGIVAPVGVDIKSTIFEYSAYFKSKGYDVITIKVTDYFPSIKRSLRIDLPLHNSPTDKRIESYIDFANYVRKEFEDDSILAAYTVFRITRLRQNAMKSEDNISYSKRVFLIHQFKRKEEVDLMRSVYGVSFFQVSVYSRRDSRIDYLSRQLAHEQNNTDSGKYHSTANDLVNRDQHETAEAHGQRVGKIFHDADFIINCDELGQNAIKEQIVRFCELLFSSNKISPTKLEYSMFAAKAAALRTLDLSRQVGAAIFRPTGEILSMGSNEVPKAGGGTYWCDEPPFDAREYIRSEDSNDKRKREILKELFTVSNPGGDFEEYFNSAVIQDSQFMDALEYGRIVHAEMNAITDAARLGIPLKDAILYSTTFPCHMCAKHIVSSGIKEVVFLEPYPKSLAADLHSDSIQIEGTGRGAYDGYGAVMFRHFAGVTPRRYRELFERSSRKRSGTFIEHIAGKARPNVNLFAPFYAELELLVIRSGTRALDRLLDNRMIEQSEE
ncbi:dCMP deaminase [Sinorhizobium meliloti]|uniref:anti-phage dCTP deaminase n=1 Tax=Rhizobium meliloti TaxID=382 RepID=UPI000FD1CAFD|nr:anti-phage dCTP deaminase [Sinorhizobium meliloti]RVO38538.1 dCMP deaminase [Sinorhizobium meliloti]RVR12145.1 dCMP deaminase [Sinorhizobium meliloti]